LSNPRWRLASVAVGTAIFLAVRLPAAAEYKPGRGIDNFAVVEEGRIYRGAKPVAPADTAWLRQRYKIKTIVDLRAAGPATRVEAAAAGSAGICYVNLPISTFSGVFTLNEDQIQRAISIVGQRENQPVFVHCTLGSDRTGTVIACHRILRSPALPLRGVMSEAHRFHLHWWEFRMKSYIAEFYRAAHTGHAHLPPGLIVDCTRTRGK
jgi:protein tyrosine phosphatase (PTP) superfamily phosphohydrolase (DUF442 family)